ncbi:hook-length control protein FliK [Thermosyntropha lipolytica DSM 11003]|uniref:Hook-length control protein FliK n=1 Tax=Thermosyntropha lipolytica DSM 11003 TaxID=1123382 RepID=A0A1M5KZQ9_9FIRM|nr:flagellar hook-length control protein FliK [Thermosyntropha lipolytica]SHG58226.1 hook-length control protein FliK [Thermosyntropha lipolytica DSM 11003]
MSVGLEVLLKADFKAGLRTDGSGRYTRQDEAREKKFAPILNRNLVSSKADNKREELISSDSKSSLALLNSDLPEKEVKVNELDILLCWGQIADGLLKLEQMGSLPEESRKISEYVSEKMTWAISESRSQTITLAEWVTHLEKQLAVMAEDLSLEPVVSQRIEEVIRQAVKNLLSRQEKEETANQLKLLLPEEKNSGFSVRQDGVMKAEPGEQEKSPFPVSDQTKPEKQDVKGLIYWEQMKNTGHKLALREQEQLNNDEMADGKRNFVFNGTASKSSESLRTAAFVNLPKPVPVNEKEVFAQIVRKAELLVKQNLSEMKIELKPEFLGKMTIKIAVEEGAVTARFIAENLRVKQMLESNIAALRQSLENQGLRVEKTEVNVQLNNGGMFDGSENSRQFMGQRPEFYAVRRVVNSDNSASSMGDADYALNAEEEIYDSYAGESTMSWLI